MMTWSRPGSEQEGQKMKPRLMAFGKNKNLEMTSTCLVSSQ